MASDFDLNDQPSEPILEFGDPTPAAPSLDEALAPAQKPAAPAPLDDSMLSEAEKQQVAAFVDKIDLSQSTAVLSYGVGAQKKVADFSQKALDNVRTNDLGEVGNQLSDLVVQLGSLDPGEEEKKGLFGLFSRARDRVATLKARYSQVETNVTAITRSLESHQVQLMKDIELLDRMYDLNANYIKELTMYVLAGKKKLERVRTGQLAELQRTAQATGKPEDAQAARDLAQACDRFEKRVYDLELTRQVALQTAPQIRMVQASDSVMAEKIQTTVVNTIPLWKNQMVIALGVEHATQAAAAQRKVSDMTNDLLRKNADALKVATVESARESERGIVDLETLRHTNEQLISTLDEVARIQREGKQKRVAAEAELSQIEGQLKEKLLEASRG